MRRAHLRPIDFVSVLPDYSDEAADSTLREIERVVADGEWGLIEKTGAARATVWRLIGQTGPVPVVLGSPPLSAG